MRCGKARGALCAKGLPALQVSGPLHAPFSRTHNAAQPPPPTLTDEGAIVKGYTTEATDAALQANIVAVGYKLR